MRFTPPCSHCLSPTQVLCEAAFSTLSSPRRREMAGGLLLLAGGAAAALAAGLPGAAAQAAAPEVPAVFKTPAGDYTPAAPAAAWARYCGLSVSVAALKDSLASAEVDWEAVRAAYADGDARFPEWPGVQAFAQEEFPGVPYWETNW